jgi:isocitrate lyase
MIMKKREIEELESQWLHDPRWSGVMRPYAAEDVLRLRGSLKIEYTLARTGAERLWQLLRTEPFIRALGAQTGAQAVQMVQGGLKAIYLSGWQVAGDMNTWLQTYPDQSLYPVDSVPTLVRRINNALQRADQVAWAAQDGEKNPYWFAPIVADAEAGFGGVLNAHELMKAMIEAGAAGVHFEDQSSACKKCGHMGGKVLVPTQQAIQNLIAARLAADVMGVPTVLVARTDSLGARLLSTVVDDRDRRFTTGKRTSEGYYEVRSGLEQAIARGQAYAPYADVIWCETSHPDLEEAEEFAQGIHEMYPGKLLAYNCSPSFNWRMHMDEARLRSFQRDLAVMGYRFQFVTLAGFHTNNLSMFELAHAYRDEGMLAYSRLQEREFELERDHGYRAVKHQSFVGAGYFDDVQRAITGGQASTIALDGSTEQEQFREKTPDFTEAEIHHVGAEDVLHVGPSPTLVERPAQTA